MYHSVILTLCFLSIFVTSVSAEAPAKLDSEDVYSLSLEELLKVSVVVASKTIKTTQDAPGIVTAYSAATLERFGYNTLADLADITPGYSSYTIFGERVFETRGQKASGYDNQKHLVIIDGIPVAHARANKALTEEELPLYFADQVEFLRGPGSALYGTSAFFGVVNISPKTLRKQGAKTQVKASLGTFDNNMRLMANVYQTDESSQLSLNLGLYDKEPSRDNVGRIDDPLYLNFDDQKSTFLRLNYGLTTGDFNGVNMGLIYLGTRGGIGEFWTGTPFSHEISDITWETLVPYIKYKKTLSDQLRVNGYLSINRSSQFGITPLLSRFNFGPFNGTDQPLLVYEVVINGLELQLESQYELNENRNIITGINFNTRKQDDESFFFAVNSASGPEAFSVFPGDKATDRLNNYSIYTQYQDRYAVLEGLLLTAGARFDTGKSSSGDDYKQLSPRIALVQKIDPMWNIKFLAGKALRAAGLKEANINTEVRDKLASQGINVSFSSINPEVITTYELGLTYVHSGISATLTYFDNTTEDSIGSQPLNLTNAADSFFTNISDKIKANGYELELTRTIAEQWYTFANYSYAKAEDHEGNEVSDVPTSKANVGITYIGMDFSTNIIMRYIDGYRTPDTDQFKRPGGYTVIDLNITKRFTKNSQWEIQVKNALDEHYKLPRTTINYGFPQNELGEIPIPGRHLLFSVSVNM